MAEEEFLNADQRDLNERKYVTALESKKYAFE